MIFKLSYITAIDDSGIILRTVQVITFN